MDRIRFIFLHLNPFSNPPSLYIPISRYFYFLRFMLPTSFLLALVLFSTSNAHQLQWMVSKLSFTRTSPGAGMGIGVGSTEDGGGSWLWGWTWAYDGSVSIVDRSPAITFPARPASFGLELADPLLGYVIPLSAFTTPCPEVRNVTTARIFKRWRFDADPVLGCPDLCVGGPNRPDQSEKWIALVQRGGCPFVEKARQAQKLGAKAVVVGGDKENPDALLNMYSERDASDVQIAATYIKYWDYLELSDLIANSNTSHNGLRTLSLLITTEYSAWEWYSPIITFIVILLLPTLLTFITLLVHRVRAARAAQRDRAPQEFVHRLPWRVWTGTGWEKHAPDFPEDPSEDPASAPPRDLERGDGLATSSEVEGAEEEPEWVEHQEECAICLEVFAKGDRVRVLPCQHMFHMDEVDEWLINKKKLCPVCKADVTQPRPPWHPHHPHHNPTNPQDTSTPDPSQSDGSPSSTSTLPNTSSPTSEPASTSSSETLNTTPTPDTPPPTERTPLLQRSS